MADVLIMGLEMPKNGECTTITVYGDGVWCAHYNNEPHGKAIPLPKGHGRLIDADKALAELAHKLGIRSLDYLTPSEWAIVSWFRGSPTIIPAEGGGEE